MSIHNQIPVDGYFLIWGMIITEMNIRVKFQASSAPRAVNRGERRQLSMIIELISRPGHRCCCCWPCRSLGDGQICTFLQSICNMIIQPPVTSLLCLLSHYPPKWQRRVGSRWQFIISVMQIRWWLHVKYSNIWSNKNYQPILFDDFCFRCLRISTKQYFP